MSHLSCKAPPARAQIIFGATAAHGQPSITVDGQHGIHRWSRAASQHHNT